MAYAVVCFIDDDVTSEVPTNWLHKDGNSYMCWWPSNTKNIKSLIMKRTEPNIKTWMLFSVRIEKYCETFGKARKIAEDPNYTSAEDLQVRKGYRKKIPPSRYINPDETDSLSDEKNDNNHNKKKTTINSIDLSSTKESCKRKSNKSLDVNTINTQEYNNNTNHATSKLPEWPSFITNSRTENTNLVPTNEIIYLENIAAH